MRVLLVNPHGTEQEGFTNPPLGLLYLAGTLRANGIDVTVVDGCVGGRAAVEAALVAVKPSLVGITCLTPARQRAIEVAKLAKAHNPDSQIVIGGPHSTIMYRQLLMNYPFIDYAVLGEGESTLLELVRRVPIARITGLAYRDRGRVVRGPARSHLLNLDELAFPAWDLIDIRKYPSCGRGVVNGIDLAREPRVSVIYSRGCTGHCDFCSTWWIWKGWRHRSAVNMVDELEFLSEGLGTRHFWFADDALTIDRAATVSLCEEICRRRLRIAFVATTRSDCVDREVLELLRAAGCYEVSYGVETGSQELLRQMGKENDVVSARRAIEATKAAGLKATALIMVGNVGETNETIAETVEFLRQTRPDSVGCLGGLWVLPGTKVYHHCRKVGFIDDSFWLSDAPYKLYTLEHSAEELRAFQRRIANYSVRARVALARERVNELARRLFLNR
jgi:anaerobic magnesium-protoporphyrin IX monomethyl ester cyclase